MSYISNTVIEEPLTFSEVTK